MYWLESLNRPGYFISAQEQLINAELWSVGGGRRQETGVKGREGAGGGGWSHIYGRHYHCLLEPSLGRMGLFPDDVHAGPAHHPVLFLWHSSTAITQLSPSQLVWLLLTIVVVVWDWRQPQSRLGRHQVSEHASQSFVWPLVLGLKWLVNPLCIQNWMVDGYGMLEHESSDFSEF